LESFQQFLDFVSKARVFWKFDEDDVGGPWFRGQQRRRWALLPSIIRVGCFNRDTEDEIREEFAGRVPALSYNEPLPVNDWDLYFLMQHYGAPTRLLDWTESPIIGLYFAVRDNPGYYDSAVWLLNPYQMNKTVTTRDEVISPSAGGTNPKDLKRASRWLPRRWSKQKLPDDPLAIFPTHIARRISSQRSCFTIHGRKELGFAKFMTGTRRSLLKVIIPAHSVRAIRFDLQNYGIDETTIFPDLDGLGRALVTSYREIKKIAPHRGVYVRLGPSKSNKNGIGVFAIKSIPKGTRIFAGENEEICWLDENSIPRTPKIRKLYEDFTIKRANRVGCPVSFNRLTPAWFISVSESPNAKLDENYDVYSLRNIHLGEELTFDARDGHP
jgi:hypothetical protein